SAHGETSIGTWVDMFTSGEIQIAEFVSGLEQFLGEGTRFDLSEPGLASAESFTTGLRTGSEGAGVAAAEMGVNVKEKSKVDLSEEGGAVAGTFATGIAGRME